MLIVQVKDRGRDLTRHEVDDAFEAAELARVYVSLGYRADRITIGLRVHVLEAA